MCKIAGMVQRLRDENAGQRSVPSSMELKHVLGIEEEHVAPDPEIAGRECRPEVRATVDGTEARFWGSGARVN